MIRTALFLMATAAFAQDDVARGAKIFAQSCAVGYCHGSGGAANRGPRLAGRSFDKSYLVKVVSGGVPGTAMPGFKAQLKDDGVAAVVGYIQSLSGGAAPAASAPVFQPAAEPPKFDGPADAKKGKDLFFDPVRGVNRCATCHAAEEWGIAIGPNPANRNATGAAIRSAKSSGVKTANASGERFPALLVEDKGGYVKVYDLTVPPPSLRTFAKNQITLAGGSSWSHGAAIRGYSDADLESIAAYLRWLAK